MLQRSWCPGLAGVPLTEPNYGAFLSELDVSPSPRSQPATTSCMPTKALDVHALSIPVTTIRCAGYATGEKESCRDNSMLGLRSQGGKSLVLDGWRTSLGSSRIIFYYITGNFHNILSNKVEDLAVSGDWHMTETTIFTRPENVRFPQVPESCCLLSPNLNLPPFKENPGSIPR